ncbi:uncharacterized protein LOC119104422 [Pollicipes pollicipes]|uniref:uncharacterized protein LOC119104422 n=1 Tax=Pollicipes pollicipes TaxID=41117 RepID=UPI00188549E7|nr:uncharacterized protein LOC119104422 [Pollicipes pollicipes]
MCPICGKQQAQLTAELADGVLDPDRLDLDQLNLGPNLSFDMLFVDDSAPYVLERRVDKSIHAAVASHLLATVTGRHEEAADRSGEPPAKRLEGERPSGGRATSFESLGQPHAR